jgi:hypothetical protein
VRFDPRALSLYLALPAIYLMPLIPLVLMAQRSPRWWFGAAVVGLFITIWPVAAAGVQTSQGIDTVGFLHRALAAGLPPPAVGAVFAACGAIGTWVFGPVIWLSPDPSRRDLGDLFPAAASASFLLVMPFSYMPWEKYALPLFIIASVAIAAWRPPAGSEERGGS